MLSAEQKVALAESFNRNVPDGDGGADVYLETDSFRMFAPLDNGDLLVRFALSSNETMDLAINPVCAVRLAATLLDLVSKSQDFAVDLALYDAATGDQLVRLRP
jgi:hypothetical protein